MKTWYRIVPVMQLTESEQKRKNTVKKIKYFLNPEEIIKKALPSFKKMKCISLTNFKFYSN